MERRVRGPSGWRTTHVPIGDAITPVSTADHPPRSPPCATRSWKVVLTRTLLRSVSEHLLCRLRNLPNFAGLDEAVTPAGNARSPVPMFSTTSPSLAAGMRVLKPPKRPKRVCEHFLGVQCRMFWSRSVQASRWSAITYWRSLIPRRRTFHGPTQKV